MRHRTPGFSPPQIGVLFAAFTLLISIPIWTHPLPPLSDYINHLARMQVIATIKENPQLARFYEIDWQVIPNLIMDFIVPLLARVMNIYVAGQVYMVGMFALIISGIMVLNRTLIGRWTAFPLLAFPLLYNYDFLVGLMNYIFGIGVALWALAGWIAVRERAWPIRFLLSTACVVLLFFCHLSALGIYGIGILSFELMRLWQRRSEPWPRRIVDFVASGLPFLAAAPLLYASPTMQLIGNTWWDQRGKTDGLMYVFSNYSDIAAWALIIVLGASMAWAIRHRVLRFHPLVWTLAHRRRHRLFRFAAHHVRHLHDRPARAARRRLHDLRLRRSGIAPPPGAARLHGRLDRSGHRARARNRSSIGRSCRIRPANSRHRCGASRRDRKCSSPMPTARSARTCAISASSMPPASPRSTVPRW